MATAALTSPINAETSDATAAALATAFVGAWDHTLLGEDGPLSGRSYHLVETPALEGVLLVLHRHGPGGVEAAITRTALRRFRSGPDGVVLQDYAFLKDRTRWGDLTESAEALNAVTEADIGFNTGCTMHWRREAEGWSGRTQADACVSTRIADEPVIINAHHTLTITAFTHNSQYTTPDGAPFDRGGPPQPEVFTRVDKP